MNSLKGRFNSTLKSKKGFKKTGSTMKKSKIKSASTKRAKELREYSKLRIEYLTEHNICERCGENYATDIHHKAKRDGKLLCELQYWMACCRECHQWIEDHKTQSEEHGWILRLR